MDTKPRIEWNGLPGNLAAARMTGTDEADFNSLELGFDADTLEEFLKAPVDAIVARIKKGAQGTKQKETPEELLTTLVMRTCTIAVQAERERVAEEERLKRGR